MVKKENFFTSYSKKRKRIKKKEIISRVDRLKEGARIYSIKEGIFSAGKESFGSSYLSPFAIAVNASNSMVALLTSLTGLLGPLSQIYSSKIMEKFSRKKIILKAVFFESLVWLPLIIIAFLFYKGIIINFLPLLFFLFFAIYIFITNIVIPPWFSWMGDIVDEKFRGEWFSKRRLIMGFVTGVVSIISALFLDYSKKNNLIMIGFIVLFSLALVCKLMAWKTLKKQYEPKLKLERGYYFSFLDFIKKIPETNFGKFSAFRALFSLANSISSPLLVVYLLRNLEFTYLIYIIITLSGQGASVLFLGLWGKFADKYGNYKVLCLSCILLPIIPILWILNTNPIYLILVPSLISGTAWIGFHLSESNFIYDNVTSQKRGLAVSYYNILNGIGIFLGAGLGALLIKFLSIEIVSPIILIFFIGSLARMVVVFFMLTGLKEVRKTKKFRGICSIKDLFLKETKPTLLGEIHEIISIKRYITQK